MDWIKGSETRLLSCKMKISCPYFLPQCVSEETVPGSLLICTKHEALRARILHVTIFSYSGLTNIMLKWGFRVTKLVCNPSPEKS